MINIWALLLKDTCLYHLIKARIPREGTLPPLLPEVFQHGRGKILAKRPQLTVSWSMEVWRLGPATSDAVLWKYGHGMGQH